jgi:hypothetical protein
LGREVLRDKNWISSYAEIQKIGLREKATKWVLGLFTFALVSTLSIYVLQGFRWGGFDLPQYLLISLGRASVCELAALVGIVFVFLFKS